MIERTVGVGRGWSNEIVIELFKVCVNRFEIEI